MAKEKKVRIITCARSGRTFEYIGYGRPPKYHPDVKAEVLKEQRATARQNQKQKKAALKAAA